MINWCSKIQIGFKKSHIGSLTSCERVYIQSLLLYMDKLFSQKAISCVRRRRGCANLWTKIELCVCMSWVTWNEMLNSNGFHFINGMFELYIYLPLKNEGLIHSKTKFSLPLAFSLHTLFVFSLSFTVINFSVLFNLANETAGAQCLPERHCILRSSCSFESALVRE